MLIVLIAPLALMVMANNLSSGLIIVGIGFVMMFIACKKNGSSSFPWRWGRQCSFLRP